MELVAKTKIATKVDDTVYLESTRVTVGSIISFFSDQKDADIKDEQPVTDNGRPWKSVNIIVNGYPVRTSVSVAAAIRKQLTAISKATGKLTKLELDTNNRWVAEVADIKG